MPLQKQDLLEMRLESRRKIEAEFQEFREEYLEDFTQLARKQQLKQGINDEIQQPGEEAPTGY